MIRYIYPDRQFGSGGDEIMIVGGKTHLYPSSVAAFRQEQRQESDEIAEGAGRLGLEVGFFGKQSVSSGHVEQRKIQRVADAGKQLAIVRKRALRATVLQSHFVNAGPFLAINSPLFDPQIARQHQDLLRVRRELKLVRLVGIDAE